MPRYRILSELGRGGLGVVHRAFDEVRGQEVALKRLHERDPAYELALKREFRIAERLYHPSLVRLFDLDVDDAGIFFTMEIVAGQDIERAYRVRAGHDTGDPKEEATRTMRTPDAGGQGPESGGADAVAPPLDVATLGELLSQLVEAVAFLHANGVVHRDLKPSNVLVTDEGQVKVLDFGIAALRDDAQSSLQGIVGTPAYMAPEQAVGETVGPPADMYALGMILFKLVAGRAPFHGPATALIQQHLLTTPARLAQVVPDVPAAIDDLCAALLAKEPWDRPTAPDMLRVLDALSVRRSAPTGLPAREAPEVIGREELIETALGGVRSHHDAFSATVLVGPSGVGKSALLDRVAARSRMRAVRGEARPREHLPFNGLDGAIDGLAVLLADGTEPAGALRDALSVAAQAFPALQLASGPVSTREVPRRVAFEALAKVLEHVAAEVGGLFIGVDDLQWADRDALAALDALLALEPRSVALVLALRDDVETSPAHEWLASRPAIARLSVPPLGDDAIRTLLEHLMGEHTPGDEELTRAVEVCAGRPFLAVATARRLTSSIRATSGAGLDVLATLSAASGWLEAEDLALLLRTPHGAVDELVRQLEELGLVRRGLGKGGASRLRIYHDAIDTAVVEALSKDALRRAHASLASYFEGREPRSLPRVVHHWLAAGERARARAHARPAAEQARAQRAFGLAVEMFGIALDEAVGTERPALLRGRAEMLDAAGQMGPSAETWAALAACTFADERIDALLHESAARLAGLDIARGRARLATAMREAGYPRTPAPLPVTLLALARFAVGPLRVSPRRAPSRRDPRARGETRAATLLSYYEPEEGVRLIQLARARADRAGDRVMAARCDYMLAYMALFGAPRAGPVPLASRYIAAAEARLEGAPADDPEVGTGARFLDLVAATRDGRWDDAEAAFAQLRPVFLGFGLERSWDYLFVLVMRVNAAAFSQRFEVIRGALADLRNAVADCGHSTAKFQLLRIEARIAALRGDASLLEEKVDAMRAVTPPEDRYHRVHVALSVADLRRLRGDPAPHAELVGTVSRGGTLRYARTMYAGTMAAVLALGEATSLRSGVGDASPRRVARWARIAAEAPPLGTAGAARAMAYVDDARGDVTRAVARLAEAEAAATRYGQRVDAAIARHQRGLRLGGDEGSALRASALAEVTSLGVAPRVLDEDPGRRARAAADT